MSVFSGNTCVYVNPEKPRQVALCLDQLLILPGLPGVRYYRVPLRRRLITHHCRDVKRDVQSSDSLTVPIPPAATVLCCAMRSERSCVLWPKYTAHDDPITRQNSDIGYSTKPWIMFNVIVLKKKKVLQGLLQYC